MNDSQPKLTLEILHTGFEFHRTGDEFSPEVSQPIWLGYVSAVKGGAEFDVVNLLRALRNWYQPWFERTSVISLMRSLKGSTDIFNAVAYGIWQLHAEGCPSRDECSLHSLGALWGAGRLDHDCESADWFVEAIIDLLQSHPLRAWVVHIPSQCARSMFDGWLTASDVTRIMTASVECGAHEYWSNNTQIGETWRYVLSRCNSSEKSEMISVGNRMVAAGLTSIIDIQLEYASLE